MPDEFEAVRPRASELNAIEPLRAGRLSTGPSAGALSGLIERAQAAIEAAAVAPLPANASELVATYRSLGGACAEAEASLLGALDALDPRTAGGAAEPAAPYERVRTEAFAVLRRAGAVFARLEPAFAAIVHGPGGWPSQPVVASADRGDGRPLVVYQNTFKKPVKLSLEEKRSEFQKRVDKFERAGGRTADIITAAPGALEKLTPALRYDYVLAEDGVMRLFPNERDDDSGPPKPGHSLLAVGGREFRDARALMAGELWVLKDSAGDLEALVVANNSGHFKPSFEHLENVLPALERLGVPGEKVVLFGGPNNLPAMFGEIASKHSLGDLSFALPPPAKELLSELVAGEASAVAGLWR